MIHMLNRGTLALLVCVVSLAGCSRRPAEVAEPAPPEPPKTTQLTLMLPCGMVVPVRAVSDAFEAEHPDVDIVTVLDNAVVLARKIIDKGATADLFISPGERQLGLLEEKDLIDPGSKRYFADLTLVVAVPAKNPAGISSPQDLRKAETISCPNPELNASGFYARQALTKLGLWDELQPKMIFTEHAIKSHQMVAQGKSEAGFMYRRCPLETGDGKVPQAAVKLAFEFPPDSYGPARAVIAVLRDSQHADLAMEFADFMVSEAGLRLIGENGLKPAEHVSGEAKVTVTAFYPGNEEHMHLKKLVEEIGGKYPGQVAAEFVDFQSDEGFERWQAAGLTCGAVLVNGEQTVTLKDEAGERQVSFVMGPGTYWTEDDLRAVVARAVSDAYRKEETQ
jgi:molybdate transport system substrate-binding protein